MNYGDPVLETNPLIFKSRNECEIFAGQIGQFSKKTINEIIFKD